jgi:DNA polymerase III delta prime subunit
MKYLKRLIEYRLEKYLKIFGAVLVEGPRGCGKSTTCLKFSKSNILFNPLSAQNITEEKLSTFLTGTYPRLIDEWQLIPFA